MLNFNASAFYVAVSTLRQVQGKIESSDENAMETKRLSNGDTQSADRTLSQLHDTLLALGARLTAISVKRLLEKVKNTEKGMRIKFFAEGLEQIDSRLRDELSLVNVFVLESSKLSYFEPTEPIFGADI